MSAASAAVAPPSVTEVAAAQKRYLALDAYRGFIMLILASAGFGIRSVKGHPVYEAIGAWFDHVEWQGAVFWDLIQPAFMFMVGVAMPFALARRMEEGAKFGQLFRHVAARSFRLLLLSQVLISISAGAMRFQLINVLAQIALTYFLCFLIMQLSLRWQVAAAALLLGGHWALFALFPGPQGAFSPDGNIGQVIDKALLGYNNSGRYVNINFITSTVTTLFGVWTGMLIRSPRTHAQKLKLLAAGMAACFAAGLLLWQWNPAVKRLWTTSWTFYSTGWVLLMLIPFYWIVEVRGWRKWTFPLVVVGMNSIFIYSLGQVLRGWIDRAVGVFTLRFQFAGTPAPVLQACATLVAVWGLCYWLYRRRIFFKL